MNLLKRLDAFLGFPQVLNGKKTTLGAALLVLLPVLSPLLVGVPVLEFLTALDSVAYFLTVSGLSHKIIKKYQEIRANKELNEALESLKKE